MKSNREFFSKLYVPKVNVLILVIMLILSIFTFSHYLVFLAYTVVLVALTFYGFKQYLIDICVTVVVMIMTALQYATNLGLISNYGDYFGEISIVCILATLANFLLIRHNYKIFVLKALGGKTDEELIKEQMINEKIDYLTKNADSVGDSLTKRKGENKNEQN